jgi:type VI protein secretion system component VasF
MTADEVRQEIEQTRERLGETVDQLAAKADIKARARAKAAEVSGQLRGSQLVRRHWPVAMTACGLVVGAVAIWQWRKQACLRPAPGLFSS